MGYAKTLIIGKIPPPIGGVTIHINRLLEHLDKSDTEYTFYDISKFSIILTIKHVLGHQKIHLHSSSAYFRLVLALISKVLSKKLYITYHGDLGRYAFIKNQIDYSSVRLAYCPIVINEGSFKKAKKINKNTLSIPAFLPPLSITPLPPHILTSLENWLRTHKKSNTQVFCTNAFNVSFDIDGNEIYGISGLINVFKTFNNKLLIFSDPSGKYSEFLSGNSIEVPDNVFIINEIHDFINIIKLSDGFIRSTTTDGDSLTVKEALFYQKITIASNCVSRPNGVLLYETLNWNELKSIILSANNNQMKVKPINGFDELYKNIYS